MLPRVGRRSLSQAAHWLISSTGRNAATSTDAACIRSFGCAASTSSCLPTGRAVEPLATASTSSGLAQRNFLGGVRQYAELTLGQSIQYPLPEATVGQPAPHFAAPAVVDGDFKEVKLSDYKGKYVILFFYPKDFTFVCPTEIIAFSDRAKEFEGLNAQLIAASTDTEEVHLAWIKTPRKKGGLGRMQIPIIADTTKEIAAKYGVLVKELGIALRGLFIINPEGVIEQITINSLPVGRSVDEALRLLQAIQFVAEHGEVCPADWKPGGKTMQAHPTESLEYFADLKEEDEDDSFGTKLHSLANPKELTKLTQADSPTVIDFYAPWCGKCRQIAPFVEQLQDKHPDIKFAKVDTTEDAFEKTLGDMGIKELPAFRFFKSGKEVHSPVVGYKKKLLETAVEELSSA